MSLTSFKIGNLTVDYHEDGTVLFIQSGILDTTDDMVEIPFIDLLEIVKKLLETKTSETKRGRDTIP